MNAMDKVDARDEAERPASPSVVRSSHLPATVVLGGGCVLTLRALAIGLSQRVPLFAILGPVLWLVLFGLVASLALGLDALREEISVWRAGAVRAERWSPVRWAFVAFVVAWAGFLALVHPYQRIWLDFAVGLAAGLPAAALLVESRAAHWVRTRHYVGMGLFATALALLLAEVGLRVLAAVRPSPVLAVSAAGPRELVERFRCAPGEDRYGFPCNDRGYYDDPFVRATDGVRIAAIGDSFNLGVVPHARNYTTVCERELGLDVLNFGVAGIGPWEYVHLLVEEALPLEPDLVVISLFVGNDLTFVELERDLPGPLLRSWFDRDRVLLSVVPRRLARLARERSAVAGPGAASSPEPLSDETARAMPWLDDPMLEEASLSRDVFLRLETQRAVDNCGFDPISFEGACAALRAARAAAGDLPLVVVLIPDEFQVEDELWDEVVARSPRELERDRPQRLLRSWLEEEAFAYLDLLPLLREVEPLADGKRHVYHRDDTHFNARGNQIVGRALAKFLRAHVP